MFVVSTNDYLAKRDGEAMGQSAMKAEQRRLAYASSVTYVSHGELSLDYLRDHTTTDPLTTV
eukprot:gene41741-50945_t